VNKKQYDVWWVDLDPTVGSELKKTRPCVILSPDEMNQSLKTIIIAASTSVQREDYPTRVKFTVKKLTGWFVLDQMRAVDQTRLNNHVGSLNSSEIKMIKSVLKEMLVD